MKDQLYYLQGNNNKLEKTIRVELRAELGKITKEKEKLEEKVKQQDDDKRRLESQIQRMIGKPLDAVA